MALSYTAVELRGKMVENIFLEMFYQNQTVNDELVTFQDDVKYDTIFSDASATVTQQAYSTGTPSASGSITLLDTQIIPIKVEYYDTFIPETLRKGRYKASMKKGAWEDIGDEFVRVVLDTLIAGKVSADAEAKFWNATTAATQTAIAALTPGVGQGSVGAAEQTYAASLTPSQFDGVVTRMIYNNAALGTRVKVLGTTITSANIVTEYVKSYTAINPLNLQDPSDLPFIYAPKSHMQLINIYNTNATYRDIFVLIGGKYYYNGLEIKFVPLPENCLVIAKPSDLHWCTDMINDVNMLKVDRVATFSKTWAYDIVFTEFAHVTHQSMNVLYLG